MFILFKHHRHRNETLGIWFTVPVVIPRKTGNIQTKGGSEVQPGRGPFFLPSVWPIEHAKLNHNVFTFFTLGVLMCDDYTTPQHLRGFHWRIMFITDLTWFRWLLMQIFWVLFISVYIFSLGIGSVCVWVCNVSCISSAGLYELLSVLPSQLQPHVESADDRSFLHAMFGERSLHSLVKVSVCVCEKC